DATGGRDARRPPRRGRRGARGRCGRGRCGRGWRGALTPGRVARSLLDTGPLAAYLFGRPAARELRTPWVRAQEAATSPVAYAEVSEDLLGRPDADRRLREPRELLRVIRPYALTYAILERYARL